MEVNGGIKLAEVIESAKKKKTQKTNKHQSEAFVVCRAKSHLFLGSPFCWCFPYLSTSNGVFPLSTLYQTCLSKTGRVGGGGGGWRAGAGVILWWRRSGGRFYPACLGAVTHTVYTLSLCLLNTPCPSLFCAFFFQCGLGWVQDFQAPVNMHLNMFQDHTCKEQAFHFQTLVPSPFSFALSPCQCVYPILFIPLSVPHTRALPAC